MLTLNTELQYKKVNRNLYTACGLRSFYRPSVLCDRAFVCHVDQLVQRRGSCLSAGAEKTVGDAATLGR